MTRKKHWEMNAKELSDATGEVESENVAGTFRAMFPEAESVCKAARKKRPYGRPRLGRGVKVVSVGIEASLLKRADRLAKKRGISRAKLVAEGLRTVLGEQPGS
jgi:hypothetical protein